MNNELLNYILSEVRECELPENSIGIHKYLTMYTLLKETYINVEKHKHWIEFSRVAELPNKTFVMFTDAETGGRVNIYDTDWEFDINSIVEVEPHVKQVTIWKPKE